VPVPVPSWPEVRRGHLDDRRPARRVADQHTGVGRLDGEDDVAGEPAVADVERKSGMTVAAAPSGC
jgi:hypothetical protein